MALVTTERARNRGGGQRRVITYYVRDDANASVTPEQAVQAAIAASASSVDGFPRVDYDYDEIATDQYDVGIIYAPREISRLTPEPLVGEAQYSFATTLETVQIRASLQTVNSFVDTNEVPAGVTTAADFGGLVNVGPDGRVQGASIQVPVTRFKYRYRFTNATLTSVYQQNIEDAAGKVNSTAFKGRAAGSVRFDGATGGARSTGEQELEFNFTYRPNLTGVVIGGITVGNVDGWDYVWPYYLRKRDAGRKLIGQTPAYVYVERIYPRADLATLLALP